MSTCRDIILEVKRRLGDVNAPVPGETDLMAFLNMALRAVWNYGAMLNSSRLMRKIERAGPGPIVELGAAPMKVIAVLDKASNRKLYPINDPYGGAQLDDQRAGRYLLSGDEIQLLPEDKYEDHDVQILLIPQFEKISERSDEIPFPFLLDQYVIEFTILAIGGQLGHAALLEAVSTGNPMTDYFRGGSRIISGTPPW